MVVRVCHCEVFPGFSYLYAGQLSVPPTYLGGNFNSFAVYFFFMLSLFFLLLSLTLFHSHSFPLPHPYHSRASPHVHTASRDVDARANHTPKNKHTLHSSKGKKNKPTIEMGASPASCQDEILIRISIQP